MAASIENVRIGLRFKTLPNDFLPAELSQRMTLVCFKEFPTIRDVENKILSDLSCELKNQSKTGNDQQLTLTVTSVSELSDNDVSASKSSYLHGSLIEKKRFGFDLLGQSTYPRSCDIWLNGYWLPSYENSKILREGDEITVFLKTSSSAHSMTEKAPEEDKVKDKDKRKRKSQTQVCDAKNGSADEGSSRSIKQRRFSVTELSQENDGHLKKRKDKKHKHKKIASCGCLEYDGPIKSNDSPNERKISEKKELKGRHDTELSVAYKASFGEHVTVASAPQPTCHPAGNLQSPTYSNKTESQNLSLANNNQKQPRDQCAEIKTTVQKSKAVKSKIIMPPLSNNFLDTFSNPKADKTSIHRNVHSLDPAQIKEGCFLNPTSNGVQPPVILAGDGGKRKRKRKRKSNKTKEIDSQPKSSIQSNTKTNRDYSLRLPHHLQPPQDNRVLFDDDDEEEGDFTVDGKCDNTSDPMTLMPSNVQGSPVTALIDKQNDKQFVNRIELSKHRKMAVSAVLENLGKHLETSKPNGHAIQSTGSDDKGKQAFPSRSDVTVSLEASKSNGHVVQSTKIDTKGKQAISSRSDTTMAPKAVWTASPAKPKSNFVSADDKFASLLGNTKRHPSNVQISPVVVSKHKTESKLMQSAVDEITQTKENGLKLLPGDSTVSQQQQAASPGVSLSTNSTPDKMINLPRCKTANSNPSNPPSRKELEDGLKPWPDCGSVESLTDLWELPKAGDFVMYKTLELSEDYTPVLSGYKKALVLEVNKSSGSAQLELLMSDAEKKREGRFELEEEPQNETGDNGMSNQDRFLATVCWSDMVGTKLLLQA